LAAHKLACSKRIGKFRIKWLAASDKKYLRYCCD
jgi:hypothetical protein